MAARVLVIEDDPRIARILERGLGLTGLTVTVAADGASGRAAWATGTFDLIVLDIMLPEIDGITLCAERRAAGDTTPVILLSARTDPATRTRGLGAGATDFVAKPFAYADLIARVRRLLAGDEPRG